MLPSELFKILFMSTVSNFKITDKETQTFKTKVALPECTMIITECINELSYLLKEHSVTVKTNEVALYIDLEEDLQ